MATNQVSYCALHFPSLQPPTLCNHPGAQHFLPQLGSKGAQKSARLLHFLSCPSPLISRNPSQPAGTTWCIGPQRSPLGLACPSECGESAHVLPDHRLQEIHSFPTCWQRTDSEEPQLWVWKGCRGGTISQCWTAAEGEIEHLQFPPEVCRDLIQIGTRAAGQGL